MTNEYIIEATVSTIVDDVKATFSVSFDSSLMAAALT